MFSYMHMCISVRYVFMGHDIMYMGFPRGSAGKEFACNAGVPSSIPGLGRSPREGIGCPLQYSWASLVTQMVKNLPARQETWVQSLGWEDPLEEGMATHSSILSWRIPMDGGAWGATVHEAAKSRTWLSVHACVRAHTQTHRHTHTICLFLTLYHSSNLFKWLPC